MSFNKQVPLDLKDHSKISLKFEWWMLAIVGVLLAMLIGAILTVYAHRVRKKRKLPEVNEDSKLTDYDPEFVVITPEEEEKIKIDAETFNECREGFGNIRGIKLRHLCKTRGVAEKLKTRLGSIFLNPRSSRLQTILIEIIEKDLAEYVVELSFLSNYDVVVVDKGGYVEFDDKQDKDTKKRYSDLLALTGDVQIPFASTKEFLQGQLSEDNGPSHRTVLEGTTFQQARKQYVE